MITFVSALIELKDYRREDYLPTDRIEHFKNLAETGIPICLYISKTYRDAIMPLAEKYSNLRIMDYVEYEDMESTKVASSMSVLRVPAYRNEKKDTLSFLNLMNNKVYFLRDVATKNPFSTSHFGWIDFGIGYIFKNKEESYKALVNLNSSNLKKSFLAIPGCWEKGQAMDRVFMNVNWRFCGGFLVGDKDSILNFCDVAISNYASFLTKYQCQIWEVNYWAMLEQEYGWKADWYYADHNDSMIRIPESICSSILTLKEEAIESYPYNVPSVSSYQPSSVSFINYKNKRITNTRFVNYELTPKGYYIIHHPESHLDTKNCCSIDNKHNFISEEISLPKCQSTIHGLEDLRLFEYNEKLHFIATQREYMQANKNRMIMGLYDIENFTCKDANILEPPTDTYCEKNWIPLIKENQLHFIYSWYPMKIGKLNESNKLEIVQEYTVPDTFKNLKGSTAFIPYRNILLGIVHYSIDGEPRRYYHRLVILDPNTLEPKALSVPFIFERIGIEYCIGFNIDGSMLEFWYSKHDKDASYMKVPLSAFSL